MIRRQGVVPGERAAVIAEHDEGLRVARLLARAGVEIAGVVSNKPGATTSDFPVIEGTALKATGSSKVEKLRVLKADGKKQTLTCDLIVCSTPVAPSFELARQMGVRAEHIERGFRPEASADGSTSIPKVFVAGEIVEELSSAEAAARGKALGERMAKELAR